MSKIPPITFAFWVMKICATTLGETAGDLLSMTMDVGYAVSSLILIGFFFATLTVQFFSQTYRPAIYWLVILTTSTAGTTMSDYMDRTLGLGYAKGSLLLVLILAAVFSGWRFMEGTLAVDQIKTRRAESLYWTTILFSNTLGTALGDYLADDSGLGFGGGAAVIGGLLLLVLLAHLFSNISKVVLFWAAFVLTRPFGATLGDVLTKPTVKGGIGLGTVGASLVLSVILVGVIVATSKQRGKATLVIKV